MQGGCHKHVHVLGVDHVVHQMVGLFGQDGLPPSDPNIVQKDNPKYELSYHGLDFLLFLGHRFSQLMTLPNGPLGPIYIEAKIDVVLLYH